MEKSEAEKPGSSESSDTRLRLSILDAIKANLANAQKTSEVLNMMPSDMYTKNTSGDSYSKNT
jgi:hypothetical protein